jgi:hypothetical protein
MTVIIMMYVFYDVNGDIRAIAPSLNDFTDKTCSVATMLLADVEMFLHGKRNPADYQVKKVKTLSGDKFTITKKIVEVDYVRTLDNYLTEIGAPKSGETIISIINQKSNKVILVEIASEFRDIYTYGSGEQKDAVDDFLKLGKASVHITGKHNPYHLLFSFSFTPNDLFQKGRLYFAYEGECENTSAYTKKVISGYGYKEKL